MPKRPDPDRRNGAPRHRKPWRKATARQPRTPHSTPSRTAWRFKSSHPHSRSPRAPDGRAVDCSIRVGGPCSRPRRALPCRPRGDQRLNQAIFGRGLIRMPMRIVSIVLAAATAAVVFSGDVLGARQPAATTEVVVTLKSPSLASFGRTLQSAGHSAYRVRMRSAQDALAERVQSALPAATIRWRYSIVANGFAVVVPRSQLGALAAMPGVDRVWPNVRYHALRTVGRPEQIGADKLWGPNLATAGNGMKIGIIDDGLQATHPYFNPAGYAYPPGLPEGSDAVHDPEGDRAADVRARLAVVRVREPSVRPEAVVPRHARRGDRRRQSQHERRRQRRSPASRRNAYLGNYKALTIPTPDFGLDGNSAEIAAAIDAAVSDGMDVINLSLGEPEIEPTRDIVVSAINARRGGRCRARDRRRQRLRRLRSGLRLVAGQRIRRDHRRRGQLERRRGRLLFGRPDSRLTRDEARRRGARCPRSLVAARLRSGSSAAPAWRRRTSRARPRSWPSVTRPGRSRSSSLH